MYSQAVSMKISVGLLVVVCVATIVSASESGVCLMQSSSRGTAGAVQQEVSEILASGTQLLQHDTVISSRGNDNTKILMMEHTLSTKEAQAAKCSSPPELDGQALDSLISGTQGVLLVAMQNMKCTAAIEGALQSKGAASTTKYFTSAAGAPGQPIPADGSDVWKWLHCTYPDDDNMHSYVFVDGTFIGNGLQAVEKVNSGAYDDKLGGTTGQSCEERFPREAKVLKSYQDDAKNRVLLFGWQGCPCTGIAASRFAASSVCYDGRTWADPSAKLMTYLQCTTQDTTHHSFVYFRSGAATDAAWDFAGTGFDLEATAMTQDIFDAKVQTSAASTTCKRASVAFNLYGGSLEECRLPSDAEGGSWMDDGKCSETSGGIHQICIQAGTLPHDFSMNTYQNSDWSESRTNSSHCICVGAWSTYMTEETKHTSQTEKITPRCKAIPETVLTKEYMANWKDWNGFAANVGMGLGELMKRCLTVDDVSSKCALKERFLKLNAEEPEIAKAAELDVVREQLEQVQCPAS